MRHIAEIVAANAVTTPWWRPGIDRWVNDGITPGGFLWAVISGESAPRVVSLADERSKRDLVEICHYVFYKIPSAAQGSRATCADWAKRLRGDQS